MGLDSPAGRRTASVDRASSANHAFSLPRGKMSRGAARGQSMSPAVAAATARGFHRLAAVAGAEGREFALAIVDIDHFRALRNVFGTGASDCMVRTLMNRLENEAANSGGWSIQLGMDEFALLVPRERCEGTIGEWGRRLLAAASAPCDYRSTRLAFTASMGIATLSGSGRMANEALRCARQALADSKEAGGGIVTVCSPHLVAQARGRGELARELPAAIAHGQLIPFYQPIVALDSGAIVGMEVLARWLHPKHGLLEPAVFIAAAEEQGLCSALTRALLLQARDDALNWPAGWTFAFNTTPNELPGILELIASLDRLDPPMILPARIELEVTETAMMRDVEMARGAVLAMQPCGVKVVLDDFGAGYANFKQLRQVPFSRLKIDKSFITDIIDDAIADSCVETIVALAHRLGMSATAEGVEDAAVAERLAAMGCDHAQGYYFGRPAPASGIDRLVETESWATAPSNGRAAWDARDPRVCHG